MGISCECDLVQQYSAKPEPITTSNDHLRQTKRLGKNNCIFNHFELYKANSYNVISSIPVKAQQIHHVMRSVYLCLEDPVAHLLEGVHAGHFTDDVTGGRVLVVLALEGLGDRRALLEVIHQLEGTQHSYNADRYNHNVGRDTKENGDTLILCCARRANKVRVESRCRDFPSAPLHVLYLEVLLEVDGLVVVLVRSTKHFFPGLHS